MTSILRRRLELAMLSLALLVAAGPAAAVRVADLHAATVPLAGSAPEVTQAAFAEALRRVLVKVTGQASAGADPSLLAGFGDPAALVQQFRRDASGNLWAQFDAAALRRRLEAAGRPIWGDDRPLTLIWLAYDTGTERDVLASTLPDSALASALRQQVMESATARGVPVILPLRDTQEIAGLTYADIWGESGEQVQRASARYQADALLIGRARQVGGAPMEVRWSLILGAERMDWTGAVADGPQGLAERLAQRLAANSASAGAGSLRLTVAGIGALDQYGQVLGYLRGLDVIESLDVGGVAGDTVAFDLRLRADREQFTRVLAARRVLEPEPPPVGTPTDLAYRLVSMP